MWARVSRGASTTRYGRAKLIRWAIPLIAAAIVGWPQAAHAVVIASDDASQSPYGDGWSNGDNGGTGFQAWTNIGNQVGSGSGGGFHAVSNGSSQINSGS